MTPGQPERRSKIDAAQRAAARKLYDFDVSTLLGVDTNVGRIKIRVPTKREQDAALHGARSYLEKIASKSVSLRDDPKIVNDTEAAFIVAVACRDFDEPDKWPVWASGEIVQERMTTDTIGSLLYLVNEVRAKESGEPSLEDSTVEACYELAAKHLGTDLPDQTFVMMKHHSLVQLYILTVAKLRDARELLAEKLDAAS